LKNKNSTDLKPLNISVYIIIHCRVCAHYINKRSFTEPEMLEKCTCINQNE